MRILAIGNVGSTILSAAIVMTLVVITFIGYNLVETWIDKLIHNKWSKLIGKVLYKDNYFVIIYTKLGNDGLYWYRVKEYTHKPTETELRSLSSEYDPSIRVMTEDELLARYDGYKVIG